MNRRTLLTLAGLAVLAEAAQAQTPPVAPLKRDLFLAQAPVEKALELVMKGFGEGNYLIPNSVFGLVTATVSQGTFEQTLTQLCQSNRPVLDWKREDGIVEIAPKADSKLPPPNLALLYQQARLPIVAGTACRMSGCVLGEKVAFAILELGAPPNSEVRVVEQGKPVSVRGERYVVAKISQKELVLVRDKTQMKIPLAPLVPKPTR
ncbi:hypothetical protein [Armatimonas sp.]|uniref:hypothetical protein n=1 Tax=Armatimonas sp. TaxID=1872638 RepID=UPI00286BFC9D|nr:hypothetical protein [Armatimonas sp.]